MSSLIINVVPSATRMPLHIVGSIQPTVRCATTVWEMRWHMLMQDEGLLGLLYKAAGKIGVLRLTCIQALVGRWSCTSSSHRGQVSTSASPPWSRLPSPDAFFRRRSSAYPVNVWCTVVTSACVVPKTVHLWSSTSAVQECGVWSFGAEVLYEHNGNLAILKSGDKNNLWFSLGSLLTHLTF